MTRRVRNRYCYSILRIILLTIGFRLSMGKLLLKELQNNRPIKSLIDVNFILLVNYFECVRGLAA